MKRSMFSNLRGIALSFLRAQGHKSLAIVFFHIVAGVANTLLIALLPSRVVAILTSSSGGNVFLQIAVLIGATSLLQLAAQLLLNAYGMQTFIYRYKKIPTIGKKVLRVDYQLIDSFKGKQQIDRAYEALFNGNQAGIEFFLNQAELLALNTGGLIVFMAVSARLNPLITAGVIVLNLLSLYAGHRNALWVESNKAERDAYQTEINYLVKQVNSIECAKDIKAYRMQEWIITWFKRVQTGIYKWYGKLMKRNIAVGSLEGAIYLARDVLIYGFFFSLLLKEELSLDRFLLYAGIANGFNVWLRGIFDCYLNLDRNSLYIADYISFIGLPEEPLVQQEMDCSPMAVEFQDVSFTHPETEVAILKHITFKANPGERIAIVGENGAGKTTIVKLLCGLYKPTEGKIILNDADTEGSTSQEMSQRTATAFQDDDVFAFSIAKNIACTVEAQIDRERVDRCLESVGLHEKVCQLAGGIDTPLTRELSELGIMLSGGETKKLLLARMLYKEAALYILDEPTASLDPIAESEIYQTFLSCARDKTTIFVSHRLSSTRFCDKILLISDGEVKETGTHAELLAAGGAYAKMFDAQANYYK